MKKFLKVCLYVALFLLAGMLVYFTVSGKIDWSKWIDYAFYGAGAVTAVALTIAPIWDKISKAKSSIDIATSNTTKQNEENANIAKNIQNLQEKASKNEEDLSKLINEYNQTTKELKEELMNVREICKLGFVNTKELVSKGVATEIAKVGVKDESKD